MKRSGTGGTRVKTVAIAKTKRLRKRKHHIFTKQDLTFGQKASDLIAQFGGSWPFLGLIALTFGGWIVLNIAILKSSSFDPYPFILLNLILSVLAAIQAPIILMAQNRQAERDRMMAKYDYQVNRKAEREIQDIQKDLEEIKYLVRAFCKSTGVKPKKR